MSGKNRKTKDMFDEVFERLGGIHLPANATAEEAKKLFAEKRKEEGKEKSDAHNQRAK